MSSRSDLDKSTDIDSSISESVSALLDNQGNELDIRRVLRSAESDSQVRAKWNRYHTASAILRNDSCAALSFDLSESISAAIADEPAYTASAQSKPKRKWVDALAKSSIAAAVAFGMLVGVQEYSGFVTPSSDNLGSELATTEPFVAPDLNSAVVPAGFEQQLSARTVSTGPNAAMPLHSPTNISQALPQYNDASAQLVLDPELQAHFNRLMKIHAQQVSDNSDLGVISFARLTDLNADTRKEAEKPLVEPEAVHAE